MENLPNFESRELQIDSLIEQLAEAEGMDVTDIISDIITFSALAQEDEDAGAYLDEVAEKIGISPEEMREYAVKKTEEYFGEL